MTKRQSFMASFFCICICVSSRLAIAQPVPRPPAVTLISGSNTQSGYDFSTHTYKGVSGGDFYFFHGKFLANNSGQRGLLRTSGTFSCNSLQDASLPVSGYNKFGVNAVAGACYAALTHNEEHQNILFRVESLTSHKATLTWKLVDDCYGISDPRQNVNCWLDKNPNVARHVIWENRLEGGSTLSLAWPQWPNAQRDALRKNVVAFRKLLAGTIAQDPYPLVDPPVNQEVLPDNAFPVSVLNWDDAFRLYVKTVAMSLAVEMNQFVPWSVTTYDDNSLAALFDSSNMFSAKYDPRLGVNAPQAQGYILVTNTYDAKTQTSAPSVSYVTPAPPDKALQFIRDNGLKGATRLRTIVNTVEWSRRLHHFLGAQSTKSFELTWQYRGPAPVSRTIAGTVNPSHGADPYHWTAGCHGTSGFLQSVLRTLNIPVDNSATGGHSLPRFMTEGVSLSHGDDPYIGNDIYGIPASALLIPNATYDGWFTNVSSEVALENLGRGNPEAMIKYLSGKLQWEYCTDPVPGADHLHSHIMSDQQFALRPHVYPLNYLENLPPDPVNPGLPASLWDRLAQKVAANGGCANTLNALQEQKQNCLAVLPVSERLDCNW